MAMRTVRTDKEIKKSFAKKGVFPFKWSFTLLFPLRNIFLSVNNLIERLDIKENYNVLEVGPGPGYFSIPVARKLKTGKLILADIQPEMLEYAKKRFSKKRQEMLRTTYATERLLILAIIPLMSFIWLRYWERLRIKKLTSGSLAGC